ncbi:hypothetical protein LMG24235_07269 [Paraburkholderia sabiae]|nr:hypothetical protein LMG24235_07269 [Paraburkholderia sabiae]
MKARALRSTLAIATASVEYATGSSNVPTTLLAGLNLRTWMTWHVDFRAPENREDPLLRARFDNEAAVFSDEVRLHSL